MPPGSTHNPDSSSPDPTYTRLHITPFDESLLKVVIPASILPQARSISYHTIETLHEKRFGFVEVPTMAADKLKKKLNGATLKGTKLRVQDARPDDMPEPIGEAKDETDKKEKKKKKSKDKKESKKRKRDAVEVIDGIQLVDRKVKRGWTMTDEEPKLRRDKKKEKGDRKDKKDKKDKKRGKKSKYTDGPELLFKTELTPIAASNLTDEESRKKRCKKGNPKEVFVHEFEKTTTVPSFFKSSTSAPTGKPVAEFIDGQGWVDADGNVVEKVTKKEKPSKNKKKRKASPSPSPSPVEEDADTSSSEEASTGDSSGSEEGAADKSSSEDDEDDEDAEENKRKKKVSPAKTPNRKDKKKAMSPPCSSPAVSGSARPKSSGSNRSLTIKIPPATPSTKVHPLEALYKKPNPASDLTPAGAKDENAGLALFGGGEDGGSDYEEEDDQHQRLVPSSQAPMTPFTRQDLEFRSTRSAAPTPDTAHPNRTSRFWPSQDDVYEEDEDAMDVDDGGQQNEQDGEEGGSEFKKLFYAERADLNRSWKAVKKSAAREKRNRENQSKSGRAF